MEQYQCIWINPKVESKKRWKVWVKFNLCSYNQSDPIMKTPSFLSNTDLESFSFFSPSCHLFFLSRSFNACCSSETFSFCFASCIIPPISGTPSSVLIQRAESCGGAIVFTLFIVYIFQQGEQIAFVDHIIDNHFWEEHVRNRHLERLLEQIS